MGAKNVSRLQLLYDEFPSPRFFAMFPVRTSLLTRPTLFGGTTLLKRIFTYAAVLSLIALSAVATVRAQTAPVKNIVLVHGGLVDGSGWKDVYKILKKDGYTVSIVQEPTISLPDDVAVTKRVIDGQNGPVILVGHSYGGVVITEAGNDPKVAGLVYVTAFAPDKGESAASLIKSAPPGRARAADPATSGWIHIPR